MNKLAYRYYKNLEECGFTRDSHDTIVHDETFVSTDHDAVVYQETVAKFDVNGTPFYTKYWQDEASVYGIASNKMYTDIGIITPPEEIVIVNQDIFKGETIRSMSQDITSAKRIECTPATVVLQPFVSLFANTKPSKTKWEQLSEPYLMESLLRIMTPDCLDELIGIMMLDEVRTDNDRHSGNFFFYKKPGSYKYNGVVPFDLNHARIALKSDSAINNFQSFVNEKYETATITQHNDAGSYKDRLRSMKNAINSGIISNESIYMLRDGLRYDLPKEVKALCSHPKLKQYSSMTDSVSRLWEYNQKEFEHTLGL